MTTWMDLEGIILTEIKTDTNTVFSLVYGIFKKEKKCLFPPLLKFLLCNICFWKIL